MIQLSQNFKIETSMHRIKPASTVCLFLLFFLCISFTATCIAYSSAVSKHMLLLLCTSVVFYFLCIITFVQYLVFKEKTYFFYIVYILINVCYFTIVIPSHEGSAIHLPTNFTQILSLFPLPLLVISYYMYVQFAIHFLRLKSTDVKSYNWLKLFAKTYFIFFVISLVLSSFEPHNELIKILKSLILILCMPIGIVSIAIVFIRTKNTISAILCIGSLFFFIGSVLGFLFSSKVLSYPSNVFPFNKWIFYTEMGTMLEAIMFFGSFAYRNKVILDEETESRQKLEFIRNDIAKNLHDEIGSTLTSINILSVVSEQALEKEPAHAKEMIHQITTQSKSIQQSMSDIVWSIRPENECVENLSSRIREYAAQTLEPLNINATISLDDNIVCQKLPMPYRKEILLICKEAINNVAKHSGASKVSVSLQKNCKTISLVIFDNGIWKGNNSGTGTKSMKERAISIGGQLNITNSILGTNITAVMPIP
jgi:signal transduction histidine kinase